MSAERLLRECRAYVEAFKTDHTTNGVTMFGAKHGLLSRIDAFLAQPEGGVSFEEWMDKRWPNWRKWKSSPYGSGSKLQDQFRECWEGALHSSSRKAVIDTEKAWDAFLENVRIMVGLQSTNMNFLGDAKRYKKPFIRALAQGREERE